MYQFLNKITFNCNFMNPKISFMFQVVPATSESAESLMFQNTYNGLYYNILFYIKYQFLCALIEFSELRPNKIEIVFEAIGKLRGVA